MDGPTAETINRSSAQTQSRPWRRLHASTYVVLLLTATVLFLLNVPGQFVPYVDYGGLERYRIEFTPLERLEHGWPWTYLEQNEWSRLPDAQVSFEPLSPWSFSQNVTGFRPLVLVLDFAVALLLLAVCGVALEHWRRQRNHLLQLRLSDFLVGIALLAIGVGYAAHVAREFRQEKSVLMQLRTPPMQRDPDGLGAEFRCTYYEGLSWLRKPESDFVIPWFDRVVGINLYDVADCEHAARLRHVKVLNLDLWTPPSDYSGNVLLPLASLKNLEAIRLRGFCPFELVDRRANYTYEASDAQIAAVLHELSFLPKLVGLDLKESDVGDHSMAEIGNFARLQKLDLRGTILSDEGLKHIGKLQSLDELRLGGSRLAPGISDSGLRHLVGVPLKRLAIDDMGITDEGLAHIAKLTELRELDVSDTSVEAPALVHLHGLKHLRLLWLPGEIDRIAAKELQKQLPQLQIRYGRAGMFLIGRH